MKVKDVPQDGKRIIRTTIVHYAENDEGAFEKVQSDGWDPGYYAAVNLREEFRELAEAAKGRVKNNETSPLEYFMYNACLDVDALAQFTGLSRRKVKKHLTPEGFAKIDEDTFAHYAHVLHTDIQTIKQFKSTLQ